tara:strand:- start:1980 stop:2111 length:132 start_codon:yes stop_codon:yes gene_type:complete
MTVAELTSKMSSKEFTQWAYFYKYEHDEKNKAMALAQAESRKK